MAEPVRAAVRRHAQGQTPALDVDTHVGARIRERRVMLGVTQQLLAELTGVSYQQIDKYERGLQSVPARRLYVIGQALGVDVGYFFEAIHGGNEAYKVTPRQRMLLDLARNFIAIEDRKRQEEVCALVRGLARHDRSAEGGPNSSETRSIAAPTKFVTKLMDVWALDQKEATRLLGFEEKKSLLDFMSGSMQLNTRDVKDRVRHLLRMREALHSLFRDIETEREWLREPRPELNDRSPLSLLMEGSMENFLVVSQFVQWMAGR